LAAFIPGATMPRLDAQEGQPISAAPTLPSVPPLPPSRPLERPTEAPAPRLLATLPNADTVRQGVRLSRGAALLFDELHRLACHVAQVRAYTVAPGQVVYHLPAVIVAALVGYSERHLYRLADELRAAGLLDERGHVATVGHMRRYDGTLWAVSMKSGAAPRLRWQDFQHDWRPDFAADLHGESGAWHEVQSVMSEPLAFQEKQERLGDLAKSWAAATRTPKSPVEGGSDMTPERALGVIAADLPALLHLHPRQRHREVSRLAADLAATLQEPERRKQWARAMYRALAEEHEQRAGLTYFTAQLYRLAADLREGAPWRKAGAVLTARLNGVS
ncbi:hypothetical protein, partial [Deinococcus ficus]|uniref:hypothetical protein n=1 Tax=Deinococcus ficus TaxID=317577 RepID=UPI001B7FD39A